MKTLQTKLVNAIIDWRDEDDLVRIRWRGERRI